MTSALIIIKEAAPDSTIGSKFSTYLIARADRRLREEVGKKKIQNEEIREGERKTENDVNSEASMNA